MTTRHLVGSALLWATACAPEASDCPLAVTVDGADGELRVTTAWSGDEHPNGRPDVRITVEFAGSNPDSTEVADVAFEAPFGSCRAARLPSAWWRIDAVTYTEPDGNHEWVCHETAQLRVPEGEPVTDALALACELGSEAIDR